MKQLLEEYSTGAQKLAQGIAGLSPEQMRAVPIPGKWSTHQVVIHLCDAELAFADRIKRIIAMDNAVLLAWDENGFSSKLNYEKQSAEDAMLLIEATRRQLTRVLRCQPPEAFSRVGEHSERGPQTLQVVVEYAIKHLDHHLKFIAEKREKLMK